MTAGSSGVATSDDLHGVPGFRPKDRVTPPDVACGSGRTLLIHLPYLWDLSFQHLFPVGFVPAGDGLLCRFVPAVQVHRPDDRLERLGNDVGPSLCFCIPAPVPTRISFCRPNPLPSSARNGRFSMALFMMVISPFVSYLERMRRSHNIVFSTASPSVPRAS